MEAGSEGRREEGMNGWMNEWMEGGKEIWREGWMGEWILVSRSGGQSFIFRC